MLDAESGCTVKISGYRQIIHCPVIGESLLGASLMKACRYGPGDLLDLAVFDVPELVLKVRVDAGRRQSAFDW
jgi:hypothetical protein